MKFHQTSFRHLCICSLALVLLLQTGCSEAVSSGTAASSASAASGISSAAASDSSAADTGSSGSQTSSEAVSAAAGESASTETSGTAVSKKTDKDSSASSAETVASGKTAGSAASEGASVPKGMYLSELTGEPISSKLKNQRPIAAMVDNDSRALPHYGTADADVVYELMNSTANNRVTRLMVLVKDWGKIKRLGSIRSTRPTNILLASEWNAVLCHDGGPYYNNQYFSRKYSAHLSGIFSRVSNGKPWEFTEYILPGDLKNAMKNYGISTSYNSYLPQKGSHFHFTGYGSSVNLQKEYDSVLPASKVSLPFWNNGSKLIYNKKTGTYDYYEYGKIHKDADTGKVLTFKNVILQDCTFTKLDQNGYLIYNCIDSAQPGFYLTGGYAKDIGWSKNGETAVTKYYDSTGEEITLNTGKTYIALVPSDTWNKVVLK